MAQTTTAIFLRGQYEVQNEYMFNGGPKYNSIFLRFFDVEILIILRVRLRTLYKWGDKLISIGKINQLS